MTKKSNKQSAVSKALKDWARGHAANIADQDGERKAINEIGTDMVFVIDTYDQLKITEWRNEHNKTCSHYVDKNKYRVKYPGGVSGGTLTYKFTHTGIGVHTEVQCECGEKLDLTNYDSW